MGLGEIIGGVFGSVKEILASDAGRGVMVEAGRAIYRHNNPPETRSLPPLAPIQGPQPEVYDQTDWRAPQGGPGWLEQTADFLEDLTPFGRLDNEMFGSQLGGNGGAQVGNGLTIPHANHPALFRARKSTAVGQRVIPVINPITGKTHFFGDLGTPLLFSRDFSAHKRVNRLARKAARGKGRSSRKRR